MDRSMVESVRSSLSTGRENYLVPGSKVGVNSAEYTPWTPNIEARKITEARWREAAMSLAFTPTTQGLVKNRRKIKTVDEGRMESPVDNKESLSTPLPVKGGKPNKKGQPPQSMEPPEKVDDQSPCDVIQTKGAVGKDLTMMKSEQASLQKEMCNKTALVSGIGVNSVDFGPWTPNVEARNKTAPVSRVGVNSVDYGPCTTNVEAQ